MAPRTLLGLGAGLSLLLALTSIADWRQVAALAAQLPPGLLLLPAAGQVVGAGCRVTRWLVMLRAAGVRVPWRRAVAAHFGSELLGPLPASPLVASYLLHRGGSAPATATVPVLLAGLWVDVLVVLGGTALVPEGTPPAVRLAGAALWGAGVMAVPLIHWPPAQRLASAAGRALAAAGRRAWRRGERWWARLEELPAWAHQGAAAFRARALLPAVALTALPLALSAAITAAVAAQLGYPQLTPARVWASGGTVLVVALASPLPFDLGVAEGAGVLAYGWVGVPAAAALAINLLGRVWAVTVGFTLAAAATWLFRDHLP